MERILELAKKLAEEAEVFSVTSENTPIQFETNRLKHAQMHQSTSVALRVVRNGRLGYATTTRLDDVQDLVNMAAETAEFGVKAQFEFPGLSPYPEVEVFDSEAGEIPLDRMVRLGEEMIAALRAHTPELLCDARISRGASTVRVMNTSGGQATYQQTHSSIMVSGTLIRGTDMLFVGESESSCHPVLETKPLIDMVKLQLERARDIAAIATTSMPVIFTPSGVVSALIEPLMVGFNGKTVLQGASPIGGRLGEAVVASKISLWDDPTVAFRPTSRPCDEEGVPSQRTPLFEQGVVANFLYDLQTASQAGRKSTGNAGRGRGLPSPSASAFVFAAGDSSPDQMIAEIKEGLVVEDLMGAGQGNVLGGDFSGNVLLGYKVENGKMVGRVKNAMVSGNVYQLLKNVAAVGNDARWVGGVYTPSLFFPAVSVASK